MLTLRRLVDDAALKMRLLVPGADDAAGAEFLWIHNTELPDPSAYVRERELVMTNGLWLADVPAADFVSSVVRAGGAGIVFGLRLEMPATPRELVDACRAEGLPLAEIAIDVPFTAISQAAAAVLAEMRHDGLVGMIRRGNALASAISAGAGASGVLRLVRRDHELPLAVVDRTGRLLGAVGCELSEEHLRVVSDALAHHPPPLEVSLGSEVGRAAVFLVGAVSDADAALICLRPVTELDRAQQDALDQAARFLSLEVAKRQAVLATELRFAGELLDMILSGTQRAAEVAGRLRAYGVDPNAGLAVCAVALRDTEVAVTPGLAESVTDFFVSRGIAVVVAAGSQDVVVVLPWDGSLDDLSAVAFDLVRQLAAPPMERPAVVGLGDLASSSAGLRQPLLQAREAARVLRRRQGDEQVAAFAELGTHRLLLSMHNHDVLNEFAANVLGPLREHDRARDGQLLQTLRVFLDHDCHWAATAAALYLHVNTLRNRMAKVAELTGRDIGRTEDRVDLFLALEADRMADDH